MLFSSISFLYYFLPLVSILYYATPKRAKNMVLLLASLVFYGWGEPSYVCLMLVSIGQGYLSAIFIEKYQNTRWASIGTFVSVAISLGVLGYFKYADFCIKNFNALTGLSVPLLQSVLPIGISFYTFQLVSYVLDVYWGKTMAQKNFVSLATYITMFPQLIAGPIVRYLDIEKQLQERSITFEKIAYGIRRFVLGLGKKVLIANLLGEFCAVCKETEEVSVVFLWAYAIAVSLQIYFDFSAYSDMAIGLGSMLGFTFLENFRYPFLSKSATEFWRRWHISLGTWFRDYVYLPLGGKRCSFWKNVRNIVLVWALTGFWHGAEWNFLAWGLYFAILLILEKTFLLPYLENSFILGHIYTIFFAMLSFVLFDAVSLSEAVACIQAMFGGGGLPVMTELTGYYLKSYAVVFGIACFGATPLPSKCVQNISATKIGKQILDYIEPVVMIFLILVVTGYLVDGSFSPFLYFRF